MLSRTFGRVRFVDLYSGRAATCRSPRNRRCIYRLQPDSVRVTVVGNFEITTHNQRGREKCSVEQSRLVSLWRLRS